MSQKNNHQIPKLLGHAQIAVHGGIKFETFIALQGPSMPS
jgi:hypothetical protein